MFYYVKWHQIVIFKQLGVPSNFFKDLKGATNQKRLKNPALRFTLSFSNSHYLCWALSIISMKFFETDFSQKSLSCHVHALVCLHIGHDNNNNKILWQTNWTERGIERQRERDCVCVCACMSEIERERVESNNARKRLCCLSLSMSFVSLCHRALLLLLDSSLSLSHTKTPTVTKACCTPPWKREREWERERELSE